MDGLLRGREERVQDLAAAEVVSVPAWRPSIPAARSSSRYAEKVRRPRRTWSALERLAEEFVLLQREVELARQPGADGPLHCARVRGESLLLDVLRLAAAAQAGIEKRDELRGVLSAYQAKAQAIGLAESLELAELYERRAMSCTRRHVTSSWRSNASPSSSGRFVSAGGIVTACARSGCDGIVEADGYCNVCGLAPVGGSCGSPPGAARPGRVAHRSRTAPRRASARVERPGCDGTVEADGYCNVCGLAPAGRPCGSPPTPSPPRRSFLRW